MLDVSNILSLHYPTEKSGVTPEECILLSKYVIEECSHLHFLGLMTIGKFGHNLLEGPNPDFLVNKFILIHLLFYVFIMCLMKLLFFRH